MEIDKFEELKKWSISDRTIILANADYYYTKGQVDKLLEEIINEINKLKNDK